MALQVGGKTVVPAPKVEEPKAKAKPGPKKSAEDAPAKSLAEIVSIVRKDKGQKVILSGNQITAPSRLPTGIFEFDFFIGGGFPRGRYSIIYGPESSCLGGDTFIQYEIRRSDGTRQNHKGGSLEKLYARFNGLPRKGRGAYQRPSTLGSEFFAPSLNEEGRVIQNRIVAVVKNGQKPCFVVTTTSGLTIKATEDHRFLVDTGYAPLKNLSVGDTVMIATERHNNLRYMAVPDVITSIDPVGIEAVYDIEMEAPYSNFVANGFVVHNCKTNIALKAAAMAQRLPGPCNKVVWVNVEQSFDAQWAFRMGVNVDDLMVVEPGYGEEAVDVIDAVVRASDVALVVVDSVAAMIANKEIGQSVENYDVGTSAMLIKRLVNKLMVAFGESRKLGHEPCVILINQTRFKIGVTFGDPETMPGGEAQKFLSSLRVRVSGKNEVNTDTSQVTFKIVKAVVKKAKIPVRAVAFEMKMCMTPVDNLDIGDTDSFTMVKGLLQQLGLLTKEGAQYKLHSTPPRLYPSMGAIDGKYNTDKEYQRFLQQMVLNNYQEKMVLVEETQPKPDVAPGVVQPIAD